ncbi:MAG TPA: S8 family serine peptidase [Thermoleophilaceae bacterium]|nr:S8 family serine peptidase [Thermoleophilaceae bacterium]
MPIDRSQSRHCRYSSRCLTTVVALAAVCALPGIAVAADGDGLEVDRAAVDGSQAPFVPGEAIVRFEPGVTANGRLAARAAAGVVFDRSIPVGRAQVVETGGEVASAVRRLERQPDVADAQPNYRYRALADAPDDTFFSSLWGLEDSALPDPGVNALTAWDTTRGAGQVIAVLDTGVALDHPDISLWNGGPGGTSGYDFVDYDDVPDDYQFHGTHVAGTAAAIDDNDLGTVGVAPDAEVMAVRVLDGDGSGSTATIAAGIDYAVANGADVINMSLGGPSDGDDLMSDAVAGADAADVVVVVAAGNDAQDNDDTPTYPCALPQPNLICVAAVNQSGNRASFSNYGAATVDVGAPGTNILSAETDYAEVLAEDFATPDDWSTSTSNGGIPWGLVTSPNGDGNPAAADSPSGDYGQAVDDDFYAVSALVKSTPISLVGQHGCRMHFRLRYELEEGFDGLVPSARLPDLDADRFITGSSGGSFFAEQASISDMDGSASATPRFTLLSDSGIEEDGVYLDQLQVLCRDDTYSDAALPTGNYHVFNGTSMATPHVAGVAALVGAADPSAGDTEIVESIKAGGMPLAALAGVTVSGRTVDAIGAIQAVLSQAPPVSGGSQSRASLQPAPPLPPSKAKLTRRTIRVSGAGSFRYSFGAPAGLSGSASFKTRRKVVVSRKGHVSLGTRRFSSTTGGRVAVKVKLSRRGIRVLRRNGRLPLRATVMLRNVFGLTSKATAPLTLRPPRR